MKLTNKTDIKCFFVKRSYDTVFISCCLLMSFIWYSIYILFAHVSLLPFLYSLSAGEYAKKQAEDTAYQLGAKLAQVQEEK